MTTVVACSLPAGLVIEQGGKSINLNGGNVSVDPENLPRNGQTNDSNLSASGFGLTTLEGEDETLFLEWYKDMTISPNGNKLQHPFGPIVSGALLYAKNEKDARTEAQNGAAALAGLDPAKDLPDGLETAKDTKGK